MWAVFPRCLRFARKHERGSPPLRLGSGREVTGTVRESCSTGPANTAVLYGTVFRNFPTDLAYNCCSCSRKELADFVVKVGEEIGRAPPRRMRERPVVAAGSSWSGGSTPWYQRPLRNLNATDAHATHAATAGGGRAASLARRRRFWAMAASELELGSTRSSQSKTAKSQDALQVSKQHLDTFALTARLLERLGLGQRSRHIAGLLMEAAQDFARRRAAQVV